MCSLRGRDGCLGGIVVTCLTLLSCSTPAPVDYTGPTAEWPEYGGDKGGRRHSPLTQITSENVGDLEVAWIYRSGDFSDGTGDYTTSSLQVTPIVAEGTMFFCTPFNRVIALDPETGAERWAYDPDLQLKKLHGAYPLTCRGVSYWQDPERVPGEVCRSRILTATHDAELIALDAATGEPCSDFGSAGRVALREGLGDVPAWEYYTTSPPLIIHDLAVVGALVADNVRANAPPGVVRAFDVRTGALRWAWDPVPPDSVMPPADTLAAPPADGALYRRATANMWSVLSGDTERDLVFVPTGNAPPDYFGGRRRGLDYYSSSVVALRASTGELVWNFQTVHHDLWDYDVAAQPTLINFPRTAGPVPAVIQATKMGHLFFLNLETGAPLFPVEERPVPQGGAPGETLSPTQPFPTVPATLLPHTLTPDDAFGFTFWDRKECRERIAGLRSEGIFTPPSLEGSIHFPSAAGGTNWGGGAIDAERGIFVANQTRVATEVTLIPRREFEQIEEKSPDVRRALPGTTVLYGPMEETPYAVRRQLLLSPLGVPCNRPPWGTLTAVDVATGTIRWEVRLGTTRGLLPWPIWLDVGMPNIGGPITTASGLVFIGAATDNYLRAFSTETGEERWRGRLPFGGQATPLTFRLREDSKQYVVIAAGGHVFTTEQGDAIVAFALP